MRRRDIIPGTHVQRSQHFEEALAAAETEFAADQFCDGFGSFREAVNLSRGHAELEVRVAALAAEQSGKWIGTTPLLARSLLREVEEAYRQPGKLQAVPRARLPAALDVLRPISVASVVPRVNAELKAEPWRWSNRAKSAASLSFAIAALAASGLLVWSHSRPFVLPPQKRALPLVSDPAVVVDNRAWAAVDPKDGDSIERYLEKFPSGVNRSRAIQALIEYRRVRTAGIGYSRNP